MASVFLFGLSVVDFIFHVAELPNSGKKYRTSESCLSVGGCATNASVAVQRLGGSAVLSSRIGDDIHGKIILQDLRQEGVNVDFVRCTTNGSTSYSAVAVDPQGERQIVNFRGNRLEIDPGWLDAAPYADAYLVDTTWPVGTQRVLEVGEKFEVPLVVDVDAAVNPHCVRKASHIAFSMQALEDITGESDAVAGLRAARSSYPNWLCVTDGENGVYRIAGNEIEHIPAFDIEAKNTLAAGDVWHGAFALRLAEGAEEDDAIVFANAVAGLKCACQGGWNCMPRRRDVELFLGRGL